MLSSRNKSLSWWACQGSPFAIYIMKYMVASGQSLRQCSRVSMAWHMGSNLIQISMDPMGKPSLLRVSQMRVATFEED
jgi:hypothetical protein